MSTIFWVAASNFESGNKTQHRAHRWNKKAAQSRSLFFFTIIPPDKSHKTKGFQTTVEPTAVCLIQWLDDGYVTPSAGKRTQPGAERCLTHQALSEGHEEWKKRLCNASPALEGVFSSPNQITEVTPTASLARGLHTVVRTTRWDVGLGNFCNTKVFRLQWQHSIKLLLGKPGSRAVDVLQLASWMEFMVLKPIKNHWIMLNFCTMRLFGSKWMLYTDYLLAFRHSSWTFSFESGLESQGEGLSLRLK